MFLSNTITKLQQRHVAIHELKLTNQDVSLW
jgi:hypothetical protein